MCARPTSGEATPASHAPNATASSLPASPTPSIVGIHPERPWTGSCLPAPYRTPHELLPNRTELSIRTVSQTGLVEDIDYFRDLGYAESEIAGMAQRALQRERLAAAEAAVAAAAAQAPTMWVAFPPSNVPNTGISLWVHPMAYRVFVGEADQREALPETGPV